MLRTGEIAPGDMVGWRDYFTVAVTRVGLCVALTRLSTVVWWNDGELVSYDSRMTDVLLGTTIYALLQLPDASSATCLEAPEGGIIDT